MIYNQALDLRIRNIVSQWLEYTDVKKMFGGVCHLLHGNMFCGVYEDFLILRLGRQKAQEALTLPYVKPFDITGKPMKGWVMVAAEGLEQEQELERWLSNAKDFAVMLSPK